MLLFNLLCPRLVSWIIWVWKREMREVPNNSIEFLTGSIYLFEYLLFIEFCRVNWKHKIHKVCLKFIYIVLNICSSIHLLQLIDIFISGCSEHDRTIIFSSFLLHWCFSFANLARRHCWHLNFIFGQLLLLEPEPLGEGQAKWQICIANC